jgi:hypothetical protein
MGLADRDRANTRHDITLRQMAMAENALAIIFCLQINMRGEKIRDPHSYDFMASIVKA